MAMRATIQRGCYKDNVVVGFFRRFTHNFAISPSFSNSIDPISSPQLSIPEVETGFRQQFPGFAPDVGSMDLMAVPKKKISKHKRGIRNGPKALKPTPVIVRCKCCGRVKLPHFYCCSGRRDEPGERSDATN
ncbi:hypothetical protein RND81_10G094700 [Saponaria officinalis]|uniref:Large ribosomal subunit protein bL32m n=1 Tax=Saponaria officinalis TaxID=3572 RepID=A0AAW1I0B0_SAPOF